MQLSAAVVLDRRFVDDLRVLRRAHSHSAQLETPLASVSHAASSFLPSCRVAVVIAAFHALRLFTISLSTMPAMTRSVFAALVVIASNALFVADALSATAAAKAKRVLVPIADGTEEIEVVTVVDVLRRAGAEVVLASVEDDDRTAVTCSRGVKIEADCHVKAVTGRQGGKEGWDLIAIPGGAPASVSCKTPWRNG